MKRSPSSKTDLTRFIFFLNSKRYKTYTMKTAISPIGMKG